MTEKAQCSPADYPLVHRQHDVSNVVHGTGMLIHARVLV